MEVIAVSAIFITIFITVCPFEIRMRMGFSSQKKAIKDNEELPDFYDTMTLAQADELVLEDQNLREYYGIEINDPVTIMRLDETK